MPQNIHNNPSGGDGRQAPLHLTSLALRSIGQVYDMNVSAARVLLRTQARAASAFGLPDWSGLFDSVDQRSRHVFSTGAEQLLSTAQRASDAAVQLQREVGRVVETQAGTAAETLQHGFEELGTQASEGLDQLVQTAREQAEEAQRVAATLGEELRQTMREGGEQARAEMRRGAQAIGEAADASADEKGGRRGRVAAA